MSEDSAPYRPGKANAPAPLDLSRDPVIKSIYGAIKGDIQFNLENERFGAVLTLTLAGIDAMAYLSMPAAKNEVKQGDFVRWAEQYLDIVNGRPLTGLDLYGARCAVLHQYGVVSRLSREGRCRIIMWQNKGTVPEHVPSSSPEGDTILASITALAESFFVGIGRYLPIAFDDAKRRTVLEPRLRGLLQSFPIPPRPEGTVSTGPVI
jgi:hypothetical protein